MHRGKETVKTISLISLILLAVFQTTELWLADGASRNFLAFTANNNQVIGDFRGYFFMPKRILTGLGDNRFVSVYQTEPTPVLNTLNNAIQLGMTQNDFVSVTYVDEATWNIRGVVYHYAFEMPSALFSYGTYIDLYSQIDGFSYIIIEPSEVSSNITYLHFIKQNTVVTYRITSSSTHGVINTHIQNMHNIAGGLNTLQYVSTDVMGFGFSQNLFVPLWAGGNLSFYLPALINNHYVGELTLVDVGERVSSFFADPAAVWFDVRGEAFIYGDTTTVVQYQNSILEYTNYRSTGQRGDLISDFSVAMGFIRQDPMVTNDVFLADFRETDDYSVFYFDYILNSLPVLVSVSERELFGQKHFIVVTVEGSTVVNYRKIAYSVEITNEIATHSTDIIAFADAFGMEMERLTFGYVLENGDVSMAWFFE